MENVIHLPIDKHKYQILQLINDNEIIIISSSTGSGKSTRIPQFIFENDRDVRLIVTQPRRIATCSLAERVAAEMGTVVGHGIVGYNISMDSKTTIDTNITFVTTGTLGAMLAAKPGQSVLNLSHIIVDEVHGRDIHTDLVLLEIKLLLSKFKNWKPKIIMLSATIYIQKFADYFQGLRIGVLDIPKNDRVHPLQTFYIDDLENGISCGNGIEKIVNNHFMDFNPQVDRSNSNHQYLPALLNQLYKIERNHYYKGAVLVFLPGIAEITEVGDRLNKFARNSYQEWNVMEMHSNLSVEEQKVLFLPVKPYQRKIILATNIAESSLTVNDIRYVVDFCVTRIMKEDVEIGFSGLSTVLASKHQLEQRAGRAGRTGPGICFRLVTKEFYEKTMEMESMAEMQFSGLNLAFLHVKKLNMGEPKQLLLSAINPPRVESIHNAVTSLKEIGAIVDVIPYSEENGKLTLIGILAINLSCDPKLARLIAFGQIFGLFDESIVIAMCLASKPIFATFTKPIDKGVNAFITKINVGGRLQSDAMAFLGAFSIYTKAKKENPEFWFSVMKENFIKSAVIRNVDYTIKRILRKLRTCMNINTEFIPRTVDSFIEDEDLLFKFHLLMAGASYPNIFASPVNSNPFKHIQKVNQEMIGCSPHDSMILEPKFFTSIPTLDELQPLAEEFIRKIPSVNPPRIHSNTSTVVVSYVAEKNERIGRIAEQVIRGMKLKAFNHVFSWKQSTVHGENRINLNGPRSSIAIHYISHFNSGKEKAMINDRDSVNLFTFDEQFPIPTTYTSTSMQISQRGNSLIAKEITLLSPMPGLYENLHLLFGNNVQLIVSEGKYIGCLVGLGSIDGTTNPVAKNRDRVISFSVKVDKTEIQKVNLLREMINNFLNFSTFKTLHPIMRNPFLNEIKSFIKAYKIPSENYKLQSQKWIQDKENNGQILKHIN